MLFRGPPEVNPPPVYFRVSSSREFNPIERIRRRRGKVCDGEGEIKMARSRRERTIGGDNVSRNRETPGYNPLTRTSMSVPDLPPFFSSFFFLSPFFKTENYRNIKSP